MVREDKPGFRLAEEIPLVPLLGENLYIINHSDHKNKKSKVEL